MNALKLFIGIGLTTMALSPQVQSADYYVDPLSGNDANPGTSVSAAFQTMASALAVAGAGDTILLQPSSEPYRMMIDMTNHRGGTLDDPLVIDGQGSKLSGADMLDPAGWQQASADVVKRSDVVSQAFLVMGKDFVPQTLVRDLLNPGEVAWEEGEKLFYYYPPKGTEPSFWNIEVLDNGEWKTLDGRKFERSHSKVDALRYRDLANVTAAKVDSTSRELVNVETRLKPGSWGVRDGTMYLYPPEGVTVDDLKLQACVRMNGMQFGRGNTSHVVVKNFNVEHVFNDAYNIHNDCKDLSFLNCNAFQCGDEGISAHETSEIVVDGAVFEQCDVGITHINGTRTVTRNVAIRDARSSGFATISLHEGSEHILENVVIVNCPIGIEGGMIKGKNILIAALEGYAEARTFLNASGEVSLENITFVGSVKGVADIAKTASVVLKNVVAGVDSGYLRIRADDASSVLRMENSVLGEGMVVEAGAIPPWKPQPIGPWLFALPGENQVAPMIMEAAWGWTQAKAWAPRGCSEELWNRLRAPNAQPGGG